MIYDLEFTTWPGAQERNWTGPGEFREIVQIGALRVDPTLRVESSFETLILQFPPGEAPATPLPPFLNLRPHLNRLIPATAPLPAGELHQALPNAAPPRGRAHNALADCHGILEALRHLRRQGHPLLGLPQDRP